MSTRMDLSTEPGRIKTYSILTILMVITKRMPPVNILVDYKYGKIIPGSVSLTRLTTTMAEKYLLTETFDC